MTAPGPRYENQLIVVIRSTVEGQYFFNVNDPKELQLIEYCYARNAEIHNIELVQLEVLPDAILCCINDPDSNASAFFTSTHSVIVKALNRQTGHSGPMLRPGPLYPPAILSKKDEIQTIAEIAACSTVAIQPSSANYPGTLISVESQKRKRTVKRPDCLNPRTFPDEEITYRPAKPLLQKADSWHTIRKRAKKARLKVEEQNRQKLAAAGKRYIGIASPRLSKRFVVHEERLAPARGPRYRGTPEQIERARKQERHFREDYRECLLALRAGETGIIWPAGTNFHHKVNGFPRYSGGWLMSSSP